VRTFDDYKQSFPHAKLDRDESGVLSVRFHSEGSSLRFDMDVHYEFEELFGTLADDPENRVVVLLGTGDEFIGQHAEAAGMRPRSSPTGVTSAYWAGIRKHGKDLLVQLLRIEAPVIAAMNGPVYRHAELPLLSDVVLAAPTCVIQDSSHTLMRVPPGDGQHAVLPLMIGINRARYYLLTGQALSAEQALNFGLVNEIIPGDQLEARAFELAAQLALFTDQSLRSCRLILTKELKRYVEEHLEYGLVLQGLGSMD
jgi:enoyl-CoA hydratase/carnithine racemase